MRILMLRPCMEQGGVTSHLALLSRGLLDRGHDVIVATSGGEGLPLLRRQGVSVTHSYLSPSTPLNLLRSVTQLVSLCRTARPDILHSHHRFTTIVGRLVGRLTNTPLVASVHEFKEDWRRLASFWTADTTVTPSQSLRRHMSEFYGVRGSKVLVIPHGVASDRPTAAQCAAARELLSLRPDTLLVGCVGRLSPEKGVRYFVESAPLIRQRFPNAEFIVVGDGPERESLTSLAASLGLHPPHVFLGVRDDVAAFVELMAVVVIPSLSESFSMVALEAMRSARPVVGTSAGGLVEVIRDGETGLIVPPGAPAALADAVCRLLGDAGLRLLLGERGRQLALEEYAPSRMVERFVEIYDELARN
jgi:glycosyltransferase involved in cell wall biosynthesis